MNASSGGGGKLRVAVIGAGFGGIGAAIALKRAGFDDVTIYEKSRGVGGTWWDNRYPGAATDAASHIYSYSYAPHDWPRTHMGHAALREYLDRVVDRFALRPHLRLGTSMRTARWDASRHGYVVETDAGAEFYNAVVAAVGLFSKPRWPDWPGLDGFAGNVAHTATWPEGLSLAGKRVAVVGTGSSAAQVVPAIVGEVATLTLFQRQAGWLLPKLDRDLTGRERALLKLAPLQRLYRLKLYLTQEIREWNGRFFKPGTAANARAEAVARGYLAEVFADRPDLRAVMTPDYPFAGKRTVVSSDFFPALKHPKVTVVPRAVIRATPGGLVDADGIEHPADAVVLCTGYHVTDYLSTFSLTGREGRTLSETWAGEPNAFLGTMVPGFPNFFILYGPNTNGGFIITNLQRQADFAAAELSRLIRRGLTEVEVTHEANTRYNEWLETRMTGTAFVDGQNYFKTASGRIVTQWPDNATQYGWRMGIARRFWSWRREMPAAVGAPEASPVPAGVSRRSAPKGRT